MPSPGDLEKLAELMRSSSFSGESRFYRQTLPEFLTPTDETGIFRISANDDPSEAVIDTYAGDHVCLARQVGPGLAFVETPDNEWATPERKAIVVRLQEVVDQGGLIYPVESVITERVWYFTLPQGWVSVRALE